MLTILYDITREKYFSLKLFDSFIIYKRLIFDEYFIDIVQLLTLA